MSNPQQFPRQTIAFLDANSPPNSVPVSAANPLPVTGGGSGGGAVDITQIAGVNVPTTPAGAGVLTVAIDQSATGTTNRVEADINRVGGATFVLGQEAMAGSLPVTIASDQSAVPVSLAGNQAVNITQVAGSAISLGQKTAANSFPITLASDNGISQAAVSPNTTSAPLATIVVAGKTNDATPKYSIIALGASGRSVIAEGLTASGVAISAQPLTGGGRAATTNPAAVADTQVVNAMYDKVGKQVVVGSIRALKTQQTTTITSSTSETTVLTAVASTFLDVYGLVVTNTSATAVNVAFKDATAGTTRINIAVPAGDTRGFMLPESGAWNQSAVNNNWTATVSASVASVIISAFAVQNI